MEDISHFEAFVFDFWLMMYAMGFKAMTIPSFEYFLVSMWWIPQVHLWVLHLPTSSRPYDNRISDLILETQKKFSYFDYFYFMSLRNETGSIYLKTYQCLQVKILL